MKIVRIRVPLYVDPFGDNDFSKRFVKWGHSYKKGNKYASRENMSEEAHQRRMKGLFKKWGQFWRTDRGMRKKVAGMVTKVPAYKQREKRLKAQLTIAKEAREVQDSARQTASQAFEVIKDVMMNADRDSDKLAAANIVLERAYGKATQVNVNDNMNRNGSKEEVSGAELDKRVEEALGRVEELTGRTKKPSKGPQRPVNLRQRNRNSGSTVVH